MSRWAAGQAARSRMRVTRADVDSAGTFVSTNWTAARADTSSTMANRASVRSWAMSSTRPVNAGTPATTSWTRLPMRTGFVGFAGSYLRRGSYRLMDPAPASATVSTPLSADAPQVQLISSTTQLSTRTGGLPKYRATVTRLSRAQPSIIIPVWPVGTNEADRPAARAAP